MIQDNSKSYADLLREISQNAKNFVSSEIALVKAEAKTTIARVGRHSVGLVIGAWLTFFAPIGLFVSAILALGEAWGGRYWLSSLVVASAALSIGLICVWTAIKKIKEAPMELKTSKRALENLSDVARENSQDLSLALKGGHS